MATNPSKLYFNNVTSMGVSYSWENTADSNNNVICTGLNHGENNFIKRSKNVSLSVTNLDLNNAGGSTIAKMAQDQDHYVVTDPTRVYANGLYAGQGRLVDYSINEGSLSNESTTNLSYDMSNEDNDSVDQVDDPVDRTESITVSRDIKGKSYTIEHSYGVSFGNDFDLISDHPLYADNPAYASVDARLALGEQEANAAIYTNPVDYGEYIDLSAYTTKKGWDLAKLENGCSGVSSNSSSTKDFINGSYSLSKTINLSYTGADLEDDRDLYEVTYTMSWGEETRGNENDLCAIIKMDGVVRGNAKNCGPELNASVYAESGYQKFIVDGAAKTKVTNFFNYIKDNISGVPTGAIHDTMFDLKKAQCNPSVDRGEEKNNGEINFSFEMHNCPNYNSADGSTVTNSTSNDVNYSECNDVRIKITQNSADISVNAGSCLLSIDESGNYPNFESIKDAINTGEIKDAASGNYSGSFSGRYTLKSENISYNPYGATRSYSVTYSDSPRDADCNPLNNECGKPTTKTKTKEKQPIYADAQAGNCGDFEIKGYRHPTKSVTSRIKYSKECETLTNSEIINLLKDELNDNSPTCAINDVHWSLSRNQDTVEASATMNGINEL